MFTKPSHLEPRTKDVVAQLTSEWHESLSTWGQSWAVGPWKRGGMVVPRLSAILAGFSHDWFCAHKWLVTDEVLSEQ